MFHPENFYSTSENKRGLLKKQLVDLNEKNEEAVSRLASELGYKEAASPSIAFRIILDIIKKAEKSELETIQMKINTIEQEEN